MLNYHILNFQLLLLYQLMRTENMNDPVWTGGGVVGVVMSLATQLDEWHAGNADRCSDTVCRYSWGNNIHTCEACAPHSLGGCALGDWGVSPRCWTCRRWQHWYDKYDTASDTLLHRVGPRGGGGGAVFFWLFRTLEILQCVCAILLYMLNSDSPFTICLSNLYLEERRV